MKNLAKLIGIKTLLLASALLASHSSHAINCTGINTWQAGVAYTQGMSVTFNNVKYQANWWTTNSPATHAGQWQDWTNQGECDTNAIEALLQNPTASQIVQAPSVRIFYLVPTDQRRNSEFVKALFHSTKHMQDYFLKQVDNQQTFSFKRPHAPVEVLSSDKTASWFRDHNPNNATNWVAWGNARAELTRILGERPANERWIAYVDSEPSCNQNSGGAADGVAIMMREDMLGLINQSHLAACPEHVWNDPFRWIGGQAHEAAHTFGVGHEDPSCGACLMYAGYTIYPNSILRETEAGLPTLRASEFFTRLPQINAIFDHWETQQVLNTSATRRFEHQGKTLYFRQYADNRFFIADQNDTYQVIGGTTTNLGSITSVFVGLGNKLNPNSADYLSAISQENEPQ